MNCYGPLKAPREHIDFVAYNITISWQETISLQETISETHYRSVQMRFKHRIKLSESLAYELTRQWWILLTPHESTFGDNKFDNFSPIEGTTIQSCKKLVTIEGL